MQLLSPRGHFVFVPIAAGSRCSKIDYSITSSALASNIAGIETPSALAVFRFTLNTSLVDCSTGSSPGFAPFKMRST